jgi:hypothetical protein
MRLLRCARNDRRFLTDLPLTALLKLLMQGLNLRLIAEHQ